MVAGPPGWHISIIPFVSPPEPVPPPGGEPYLDPPSTVGRRRRRPAGWALTVVVAVVVVSAGFGVAALFAPVGGLLPHGVSRPAGLVGTTVFAPAGAGVSLVVPADWVNTGQVSGFLYSARAPRPPHDFVLAGAYTTLYPISARTYEASRWQTLTGDGDRISSHTIGTIGGHPAIRLRYTLRQPTGPVADTEYDISTATRFGSGRVLYNWITVVIGRPASSARQLLLMWMASTIKLIPAEPPAARPTYIRTGS